MPGMGQRSIDLTNPFVVALFRHASFVTLLLWLGGVAMALLVVLALTGGLLRFNLAPNAAREPRARTYLRWGFGGLWFVDGLLQFQSSMPLGLANNVVAPMSVGTPSWLHSVMSAGITLWNSHPVTMASGVAWLQVGLGLLLIVSRGVTSRFAGAASAGWAALVWLVGNGAGGVFIHGASLLFGWPGASLFYLYAGVWIALDSDLFRRRFSVVTRRSLAVVLLVGAGVQALPAAGFWHGGSTNALTAMANYMSAIAQPHWLAYLVRSVGSLAATMGGGLNVVVLMWLVGGSVGLWASVTNGWRWPTYVVVGGALALWIVVQDTALFGGLATDVNSLPAVAMVAWCASPTRLRERPRRTWLPREMLSSSGSVVATFAASMVVVGGVAMAWAAVAGAETTLYLAQNGPATAVNAPAKSFRLIDQFGRPYRLGEHPGHVTLLTFLDPHCWTDCPLLASQLAHVRQEFSARAKLDIVAVAADPYHESLGDVRHFIDTRGLRSVPDFYFVTGTRAQTSAVWRAYGISVTMKPTDQMSVHSDFMFIIGANQHLHWIIPDDPLASSAGTASAVAELHSLLWYEGVR